MAAKKSADTPEIKISLYKKLISSIPQLELKVATIPYTSVNGHMFTFLYKAGRLALRLPEELRKEFIKKFKTSLCIAHGTVLKEFLNVPVEVLSDSKTIKKYFLESFSYVSSLKPKATKR